MPQQGMRTFSTEFKKAVVLRLEAGERIAAVSEELKITRKEYQADGEVLLFGAHIGGGLESREQGNFCARTAITVTLASSPAAGDCRGGDRLLSGRK